MSWGPLGIRKSLEAKLNLIIDEEEARAASEGLEQ